MNPIIKGKTASQTQVGRLEGNLNGLTRPGASRQQNVPRRKINRPFF
jgi:hypothetical protein